MTNNEIRGTNNIKLKEENKMMKLDLYESRLFGRVCYGFGRDENGYISATCNSEKFTKNYLNNTFYDVVIHKGRKPGIYLEFDDHMRRLFSIEFFKRLIVQYLRE